MNWPLQILSIVKDIFYILQYFVILGTYSKISNGKNEFRSLRGNINLSEVSVFSYLGCHVVTHQYQQPSSLINLN